MQGTVSVGFILADLAVKYTGGKGHPLSLELEMFKEED